MAMASYVILRGMNVGRIGGGFFYFGGPTMRGLPARADVQPLPENEGPTFPPFYIWDTEWVGKRQVSYSIGLRIHTRATIAMASARRERSPQLAH